MIVARPRGALGGHGFICRAVEQWVERLVGVAGRPVQDQSPPLPQDIDPHHRARGARRPPGRPPARGSQPGIRLPRLPEPEHPRAHAITRAAPLDSTQFDQLLQQPVRGRPGQPALRRESGQSGLAGPLHRFHQPEGALQYAPPTDVRHNRRTHRDTLGLGLGLGQPVELPHR